MAWRGPRVAALAVQVCRSRAPSFCTRVIAVEAMGWRGYWLCLVVVASRAMFAKTVRRISWMAVSSSSMTP